MKKAVDPSAERPARAADRIRASASELFYREGIRAVGVDEVVDRAGVTKPSLYRSFASKDDLAAAYMRDYELDFWEKFERPGGKSYSDAREHVLAYIRWLSARAVSKGYRGCGLSNATVEYPSRDNPARQVAEGHKKVFRKRLCELAAAMGARHPACSASISGATFVRAGSSWNLHCRLRLHSSVLRPSLPRRGRVCRNHWRPEEIFSAFAASILI